MYVVNPRRLIFFLFLVLFLFLFKDHACHLLADTPQ